MRSRALRLLIALGGLVVALAPWTASEAQYFGQNRVQYRTFDFRVLTTTHFDIYYYPEEEAAVRVDGASGRALAHAALAPAGLRAA